MLYELCNSTCVAELTTLGTASSSTLKSSSGLSAVRRGSLEKHKTNSPSFSKRSETKRLKKSYELYNNSVSRLYLQPYNPIRVLTN